VRDGDTVLTGLLQDRSAVYAALAQIEALGLELLELRQVGPSDLIRYHDEVWDMFSRPRSTLSASL
jgi:hypothetical protein